MVIKNPQSDEMEITTKSFRQEVLEADLPVLLECWASWCLPCKQMEPALERVAQKFEGICKIHTINVDKNPVMSTRYNVKGLPSVLTFIKGEEFERQVGSLTDQQLTELVGRAVTEFQQRAQHVGDEMSEEEEQAIIEERLKNLGYL